MQAACSALDCSRRARSRMLACHAGRAVNKPLIQALSLGKTYYVKSGLFRPRRKLEAVSGVDFAVDEGTTFGLVGESGSGKSTIARLVLGVERPTTGRVEMMGNDVPVLDDDPAPAFRRLIQPVMQDSTAALDPRMNVGRIIEEPLQWPEARDLTLEVLCDPLNFLGILELGIRPDVGIHDISDGRAQCGGIACGTSIAQDVADIVEQRSHWRAQRPRREI